MKTETTFTVDYSPEKKVDLETITPLDFRCIMTAYIPVRKQLNDLERLYLTLANDSAMSEKDEIDAEEFELGKLADRISRLLEMVIDAMED